MYRLGALAFATFLAATGCRTTGGASATRDNGNASEGPYTCEYKHEGRRQGAVGSVALGESFPGFERGEKFVVRRQVRAFQFEAITTLDLQAQPYLTYAFSCDHEHNCSGFREKHAEGRPAVRTAMQTTPGGANVLAYLKKRPVFGFRTIDKGVEFWAIRAQKGNPVAKGTTVTCTHP